MNEKNERKNSVKCLFHPYIIEKNNKLGVNFKGQTIISLFFLYFSQLSTTIFSNMNIINDEGYIVLLLLLK